MISAAKLVQIRAEADLVCETWQNHVEVCEMCEKWYELGHFETYQLKCVEGYIIREKVVLFLLLLDKPEHFSQ
jgi:hypothetical protein